MSETKAAYTGVTREPVRALDDARQIAQLRALFEEMGGVYTRMARAVAGNEAPGLYEQACKMAHARQDRWRDRFNAIVTGNVDRRAVGREGKTED